MTVSKDMKVDISTVVAALLDRYGPLAMARAAGAAADAARNGDQGARALWGDVLAHLRRQVVVCQIG